MVWTDNRNVVQPMDGNWQNFTPVGSGGGASLFDPNQTSPSCMVGQTGVRNQDIYTATLSPGIIMGAKGNFKQLSTSLAREFPITVENPTNSTLYYRLTIAAQPSGGSASFLQYPVGNFPNPLTNLTIGIPPLSSASRSVFITSSNASANVTVNAVQTDLNNNLVPGGLSSNVTLNSDPSNPAISNPDITTAEVYTPAISNPAISNPAISNPAISNPAISNPAISNVTFVNPAISNPAISNPAISNPAISNPAISNPAISNTALAGGDIIQDINYTVTNAGNTAVSYTVNLQYFSGLPNNVVSQLIISGVYLTPVAQGCTLAVQAHYTPIANIINPVIQPLGFVAQAGPTPALTPSFSLEPGQRAIVTIRLAGPTGDVARAQTSLATPVVASQGVSTLSIATTSLPPANPGTSYSATIQATGGNPPYTWTVIGLPSIPPFTSFSAAPNPEIPGQLDITGGTGDSSVSQTFNVVVRVTDASGKQVQKTFTLTLLPG